MELSVQLKKLPADEFVALAKPEVLHVAEQLTKAVHHSSRRHRCRVAAP